MLSAGLLTPEQLTAIFLNVEELLEHNLVLAEKLKDAVEFAQVRKSRNTIENFNIFSSSNYAICLQLYNFFSNYTTEFGK